MAYQKERALFQLNLPSCVTRRVLCQVVMITKYSSIKKEFFSLYQAKLFISIQLFRERLSEKVHVTIPKGIVVGGFEFTVL